MIRGPADLPERNGNRPLRMRLSIELAAPRIHQDGVAIVDQAASFSW
jgi:hypothetical protein